MNVKAAGAKLIDLLIGLAILLSFQFVGQTITDKFALTLPGPVIGMLLLFVALTLFKRTPKALSDTSAALIKHLSLFFLPAATGIFFLGPTINRELPAIMVILVVSTLTAMVITALVMNRLIKKTPLDESAKAID